MSSTSSSPRPPPAATAALFGGGSGKQQDEGAGVVYNDQGYILTDQHVVADASSIKVTFQDGLIASGQADRYRPVDRRRRDQGRRARLELHPLTFADSSSAQVGDDVVAIGSPFGLPETVTSGSSARPAARSRRPNSSRSRARSRPMRRSTRVTRAVRCSTPTATCSASTTRSRPITRPPVARARARRRLRDPRQRGREGRQHDHLRQDVEHGYVGVSLAPSTEGGAKIAPQGSQSEPAIVPARPRHRRGLSPAT